MSCLSRLLPNKRSIMAALATGGSFLPLLMRYVFGSYIPSFQQLMVNPVSFDCFSRGSVHSLLAHQQVIFPFAFVQFAGNERWPAAPAHALHLWPVQTRWAIIVLGLAFRG